MSTFFKLGKSHDIYQEYGLNYAESRECDRILKNLNQLALYSVDIIEEIVAFLRLHWDTRLIVVAFVVAEQ